MTTADNDDEFIEPTQADKDADQVDRIVRMAASLVKEGEPGCTYILGHRPEEFQPHPWVLNAARSAFDAGREEGRKAADLEHRMLADALEETFTTRESHLIHSAISAIMETAGLDHVDLDIERMRTISDRVKLRYEAVSDLTTVRITLVKL